MDFVSFLAASFSGVKSGAVFFVGVRGEMLRPGTGFSTSLAVLF